MQVDGHAQRGDPLPEFAHRLFVEILHLFVGAKIAVAIDECALESKVHHRALQLVGGCTRVLQRDSGECR
jgi:hypothetical protein